MENNILSQIQFRLVAKKGQYNNFGKYSYRSCEDILEGLKPLLDEFKVSVVLEDEVINVGDRYYIKATAKLFKDKELLNSASASAREPQIQKGMNDSQITGSASSYARKYALNGLFAIDDNKDADTNEYKRNSQRTASMTPPVTPTQPNILTKNQIDELTNLLYTSKANYKDFFTYLTDKLLRGITGFQDLTPNEYQVAKNVLEQKIRNNNNA